MAMALTRQEVTVFTQFGVFLDAVPKELCFFAAERTRIALIVMIDTLIADETACRFRIMPLVFAVVGIDRLRLDLTGNKARQQAHQA